MSTARRSGIETSEDGSSYIPSSTRADGTTRKEIRVRPGYRPPEDVETYKSRGAEAWRNRGTGGVPGSEMREPSHDSGENKSKNAKRREAAKRKKEAELEVDSTQSIATNMEKLDIEQNGQTGVKQDQTLTANAESDEAEIERQKKIRNQLKKLRAVQELKEKKAAGEKLSHEQIVKIGKEEELIRDLKKLKYDGPELSNSETEQSAELATAG